MKSAVNVIIITLSLMICSQVHAASITYGQTIDVDGSLRLISPGNVIVFPDGTTLSSATVSTPAITWGGITGDITHQTDLQTVLSTKPTLESNGLLSSSYLPPENIQYVNKSVLDYTPSWFTQGSVWQDLPDFELLFTKTLSETYLQITYTDNIGIYSNSWCNIGVFIDDWAFPICYGSWSGSQYTTTFNQQTLNCLISPVVDVPGATVLIPPGPHVFKVKHRSQYCMYGNYAFDQYGAIRQLVITEVKK